MSSLQDTKVREEFIARCNGLHIKAKENKVKLAPPPTSGKHPGHYQAPSRSIATSTHTDLFPPNPTQSSFERQFGLIASENQATSRPFSQRKQDPSLFDHWH